VVLSAVGLRPRIQLARDAGIATGMGIQVNRQLQTNLDSIYAIGDCAETDGLVLPYVMPIMQAARALAPILLGQAAALQYPAMPVMVKTPAYPIVVSPPAKGAEGQWKTKTSMEACSAALNLTMVSCWALLYSAQRPQNALHWLSYCLLYWHEQRFGQ
jgi:rubredoxin---NAD+ reductase